MSEHEKRPTCCGGSDEHPPRHTQDCSTSAAASERMTDALRNVAAGRTMEERKRLLAEAESAFTALLNAMWTEHSAEVSAARDVALEEGILAIDAAFEQDLDESAQGVLRALQSRPASVLSVDRVRAVLLELAAEGSGAGPSPVMQSMAREALRRLGVDLGATGGETGDVSRGVTDHPSTFGTAEQAQALREGKPLEWRGETTTGPRGCDCNGAPHAEEQGCPGWSGETATVENGLLPASRKAETCPYCHEAHSRLTACHREPCVYDEPAHEPTPGTCKGCDKPADAPPEQHRFSCTRYGKRQLKLSAKLSHRIEDGHWKGEAGCLDTCPACAAATAKDDDPCDWCGWRRGDHDKQGRIPEECGGFLPADVDPVVTPPPNPKASRRITSDGHWQNNGTCMAGCPACAVDVSDPSGSGAGEVKP